MAFDFPSSPSLGQKYPVSPAAGQPQYTWDGSKWTTIGVAITSPGMGVLASDTPPASPADNTLWFCTTDGVLYIYFNDGNTRQWVAT